MKHRKDLFKKQKEKQVSYRQIDIDYNEERSFNRVSTQTFTSLTLFPKTLLELFENFAFLWFVFLLSISLTRYIKNLSVKISAALSLFILVTFRLVQNGLLARSQYYHDKKLNEASAAVFTGTDFTLINSGELREGDLILIKKGESCPADSLILAVDSELNEAYVEIKKITGCEDFLKKRAVKETQSFVVYDGMNISELKDKLEYVKIVHQSPNLKAVDGKIKVKGSPKVVLTTNENYLMAGSRVEQCGWVLCLVLYCGNDSKRWLGYDRSLTFKNSKLSYWVNICLFFNFGILVFYVILNSTLGSQYKELDYKDTTIDLVFNTIVLYGHLVPITLYLGIEIMSFIKCQILNFRNKKFQVHNQNALKNLGKAEYILMEKSGVLVNGETLVQACLVDKDVYFDNSNGSDILEHGQNSLEIEYHSSSSSSNFSGHKDNFEDLKNDVVGVSCSKDKHLFGVALIVCNSYMSNESQDCTTEDDEALLKFSQSLGFKVITRSEQLCELEAGTKKFSFSIISYGEANKSSVFKLLLKDNVSGETIMIFRGSSSHILDLFEDEEEIAKLEEHASSNAFRSLRKIVFGYKIMTIEEVKAFMLDYKQIELTTVNKKQRVLDVFENHSHNIKLLSIIGLDKITPEENVETIEYLEKCGIKVWICSEDNEESILASGYRCNMISDQQRILRITDYPTVNDALLGIRTFLNDDVFLNGEFKEQAPKTSRKENKNEVNLVRKRGSIRSESIRLQKKKSSMHSMLFSIGLGQTIEKLREKVNLNFLDFVVSIDGDTLDLALTSHELMKNLIIILFTAKSVFAFNMTPEQKKNLVKAVKESLDFKPVVVAVANRYGNEKMLSEATVGIKIDKKIMKNRLFADVSMKKLHLLPDLLVNKGTEFFISFRALAFLTIFKELSVLTLLFLYQGLCSFSSCHLIDPDLLIIYEFVLSLFYILSFSMNLKEPRIKENPESYCCNFIYENQLTKKIAYLVVYSIFNGILLYFFIVYGISVIVNKDGFTEDSQSSGLVAFILVNVIIYIQGFWLSEEKIKAIIVSCLSFTILILILALTANGKLAYYELSNHIITNQSTFWSLLCIFPLFLLLVSGLFIWKMKLVMTKLTSRIAQYSSKIKKVFCESSNIKYSKEEDDFELSKYDLTFRQVYRENLYKIKRYKYSLIIFRFFLATQVFTMVLNNILAALGYLNILDLGIFTVIATIFYLLLFVASFLIEYGNFAILNFVYFSSILVFSITETFYNNRISTVGRFPELCLIFCMLLYSTWRITILKAVTSYFISIVIVVYEISHQDYEIVAIETTIWVVIMLCIIILLLLASYFNDLSHRQEYVLVQKAEIEVEKSSSILSYLLPEFVRKRVKDGVRYIAEDKGTVSVIFCDICDFDKIMDIYSPQELTFLIDDIFGKIDKICENLGVTKIETVGKTYLACTGLKDSETGIDRAILKVSHARRALEMAFEIIKESSNIFLKDGSTLTFKIGISSGPVTAGVVGFHKPQFSLVGDTVNTSSRMASTLTDPNTVQISNLTYDLLEDNRGFIFKDCLREVKGKGTMNTKVVTMSSHNIDEILTDDLNSIFNRRRSSVLNLNSTPTLMTSGTRISDKTHISTHFRSGRSSLMVNLDIKIPTDLFDRKISHRLKKCSHYLLRETEEEINYRKEYSEVIAKFQIFGLVVSSTCSALLIVAELVFLINGYKKSSLFRLLILVCGEIGHAAGIIMMKKVQNKIKFSYYLSALYSSMFVCFWAQNLYKNGEWVMDYMYLNYSYFLLNFFSGTLFKRNIPFNIPIISLYLIQVFRFNLNFPHLCYTIGYIALILILVFINETKLRINAILKAAAQKELEKTKQLLTQMMPPHALAYLEEGKEVTDRLTKVTLMFADIVGFTAWSSERTPREVVGMLSELFTRFDRMCVENNVYKVHTIGDCYVAIGYVDDNNRNPAKEAVNLVKFAMCLLQLIEETNQKCGIQLGMRIGIHTGDIIGGITGTKVVRYDIYGSNVLIANKMESSGEAGKIAVSETTKEIIESFIPGSYQFLEAKEVKVPSLSKKIKLYFLSEQE